MSTRSDWPQGLLNRERTLQLLREHNAWRRGAEGPQADPRMLGLALDAAIEALASAPQPPSGGEVSIESHWLENVAAAALLEGTGDVFDAREAAALRKLVASAKPAAPPSAPVGVDLPPAAERVGGTVLGSGFVQTGDWAIPSGSGGARIVDERMAYGWNECRKAMQESLAQQPAAVECPHRTRCDCLAACKYGYAGDGAKPAAVDELPDCPHSALDGCDCYATQPGGAA